MTISKIISFDNRTLAELDSQGSWLSRVDSFYPQIGSLRLGSTVIKDPLYPITLSEPELVSLYVKSQPIANAVDVIPNDGLKKPPNIKPKPGENVPPEVVSLGNDLLKFALPPIRQCAWQSRLFGWAILLMATDNDRPEDLSKPLDTTKSKAFIDFRAIAGGACTDTNVSEYWDDPMSRNYGMPLNYRATPMLQIHHSRVCLMRGLRDHRPLKSGAYQLGYSVAEPLKKAWDDYQGAIDSLSKLLRDKTIEVFSIENFKEILRRPAALKQSIEALKFCREELGGYLMDSTGTFQLVDRALAGIKDVMEAFIGQMSMSANLPDTIIMGMSPAGQTSGEYEKAILQKLTSIWQCLEAEPVFRQILDNFFAMQGYPGVKYSLEFDSSVENGDKEQSEIDKNMGSSIKSLSEALKALVEGGIMSPDTANEIAVLCLGEGIHQIEIKELTSDPNKLPPKPEPTPTKIQESGSPSKLPT